MHTLFKVSPCPLDEQAHSPTFTFAGVVPCRHPHMDKLRWLQEYDHRRGDASISRKPHSQPRPGQVLFEPEEDVVTTYFPLTGTMAALIVVLDDGRTAEAASIGREGAIGGIVSAGHKPAFTSAVVQIAGPAFRVERARIEVAKQRSSVVRDLFARYADVLLAQVLQCGL